MKTFFETILIYFLRYSLILMPIPVRYKFIEKLGTLLFCVLKKRREITLKNLKMAFPEKSQEEIDKLALESFQNTAKAYLEIFWMKDLVIEKWHGKENFDNILEKKKGIIVLALHLGSWEMGSIAIPELHAVAKRQSNKTIDKMITKIREGLGTKLIYKGDTKMVKEILKAIKKNKPVGLIADQYDKDIEVEFFGHKTFAAGGPALFAVKYDVPVMLAYCIRKKDNVFIAYTEKETEILKTDSLTNDIKLNTQKFTNMYEKLIREYPNQWLWQHRRWRDIY